MYLYNIERNVQFFFRKRKKSPLDRNMTKCSKTNFYNQFEWPTPSSWERRRGKRKRIRKIFDVRKCFLISCSSPIIMRGVRRNFLVTGTVIKSRRFRQPLLKSVIRLFSQTSNPVAHKRFQSRKLVESFWFLYVSFLLWIYIHLRVNCRL